MAHNFSELGGCEMGPSGSSWGGDGGHQVICPPQVTARGEILLWLRPSAMPCSPGRWVSRGDSPSRGDSLASKGTHALLQQGRWSSGRRDVPEAFILFFRSR